MSQPQEYQGLLRYRSDLSVGPHRLFVAIPCLIADLPNGFHGLLDTAAEWCVLPPEAVALLGLAESDNRHRLQTRLGTFAGGLERVTLHFPPFEGELLSVDATCFVSPDWPGPLVLGWKGCLERCRFALDPGEERFYFGA